MKIEDFKIQIIDNSESYTAFVNHKDFTGIVVQVGEIKNIPKALAKAFEGMFEYSIENNNFEISEWDDKQKRK